MKTRSKVATLVLLCLGAAAGTSHTTDPTVRNGEYYIAELKAAMTSTFEANQGLINVNADGSTKSEDLTPKKLYKSAYKEFKKIAGKDFKMSEINAETDPEKIAPILAAMLQGGRITVAKAQTDINGEANGESVLKKFIPAVFGRLTAENYAKATGVVLKQTTLGKGDYGARNDNNKPAEWEIAVLRKFTDPDWNLNEGVGNWEEGEYRFMKPVYIKKGCLGCHGDPIGELGPYGHAKEGYKVGDVRGGISVTMPGPE